MKLFDCFIFCFQLGNVAMMIVFVTAFGVIEVKNGFNFIYFFGIPESEMIVSGLVGRILNFGFNSGVSGRVF